MRLGIQYLILKILIALIVFLLGLGMFIEPLKASPESKAEAILAPYLGTYEGYLAPGNEGGSENSTDIEADPVILQIKIADLGEYGREVHFFFNDIAVFRVPLGALGNGISLEHGNFKTKLLESQKISQIHEGIVVTQMSLISAWGLKKVKTYEQARFGLDENGTLSLERVFRRMVNTSFLSTRWEVLEPAKELRQNFLFRPATLPDSGSRLSACGSALDDH